MDQARDVSMAPLEFQHMPTSEYLDRYDGITSELNVNMEYDNAVDDTTTYLGHESIKFTDTFDLNRLFQYTQLSYMGTVCRRWNVGYTPQYRSFQELYVQRILHETPTPA